MYFKARRAMGRVVNQGRAQVDKSFDKNKGRSQDELLWLDEWKNKHKKEVNAVIKKLQHKSIEVNDENINNEILEPSIHIGMKDYGGTGNPDTRNIIQLDHIWNWEMFLQVKEREFRDNRDEFLKKLNKVLNKLSKKDRLLLAMRFGLDDYKAVKLREIAVKLKTTPIEINNMVNRVLKKAQIIAAKLKLL